GNGPRFSMSLKDWPPDGANPLRYCSWRWPPTVIEPKTVSSSYPAPADTPPSSTNSVADGFRITSPSYVKRAGLLPGRRSPFYSTVPVPVNGPAPDWPPKNTVRLPALVRISVP